MSKKSARREGLRPIPLTRMIPGALLWMVAMVPSAFAEMTDLTQTPNTENAGIKKSLEAHIGVGRGGINSPRSSLYMIGRDPFRAIVIGQRLFQRKFTVAQGFGPRIQDGIGDIEADPGLGAGLVDSCAGCHGRPHGSAGSGGNVFTRPDSRDAPHLFGLGLIEMIADEITDDLRALRAQAMAEANTTGDPVTKVLVSKGIGFGTLRALPNGSVDTSGVEGVDGNLRVKPFFAEGSEFSIRAFSVGAFQAEMGLQPVDPDLKTAAAGHSVVTPAGMRLDGAIDSFDAPIAHSPSKDPDGDGAENEIDVALVDYMEFYLLNYFKPARYRETAATGRGKKLFGRIGCAECHTPDIWIERDRRVADVETVYDPKRGIFNNLFATASLRHDTVPGGSGYPALKPPKKERFLVKDVFADFKRHDLGPGFHERNFDGTVTTQFMTEPLWGIGSTAPYGHDGRSINLEEVILRHGGEAQEARDRFVKLGRRRQARILDFLNSLVLFGPPDTASNLDGGDPLDPHFPQRGHGSVDLSTLFNDPSDKE